MLIENLNRYCEASMHKAAIHPRQDNYDEIVMCDPCKAFIRGEHFLNNKKVIQKVITVKAANPIKSFRLL